MATYSRREKTTRTVTFEVPADLPYGASWAEVMKAIRAAHEELWEAGIVGRDRDASDDRIWIRAGGEPISVVIELPAEEARRGE